MGKLLKVKRDGDLFVMRVENESGHREDWYYAREETSVGVSFSMVGREDVRK